LDKPFQLVCDLIAARSMVGFPMVNRAQSHNIPWLIQTAVR